MVQKVFAFLRHFWWECLLVRNAVQSAFLFVQTQLESTFHFSPPQNERGLLAAVSSGKDRRRRRREHTRYARRRSKEDLEMGGKGERREGECSKVNTNILRKEREKIQRGKKRKDKNRLSSTTCGEELEKIFKDRQSLIKKHKKNHQF